ncbi:hypothetical protein Tsubulata_044277 [Turnera subulata]|uniref:Saposin B-type domain-containing protein n=1 Tax=Turnera subulata TaxID=218843 RepID=A0A9Q0JPJ6_9ROSI|nr:hypothetical protein Tsubulata_044277 [Turnera subulata]
MIKKQIPVALVAVVVVLTCLPLSHCAIKKPVAAPRREDVPYIKCQVCEKIALQLHDQVQKKQAQISPKKITEFDIIEIAENVCNLKKEEADWIMKIDIVEKGDKLELVEQDAEGQCNTECKTIESACQEVMGYADTDVAEYIYMKKPQLDTLVNYFCKDLTDACAKKTPPVPKGRTPGEAFVPKPSKEAEMERIMRSMQGMPGAPGMQMYSREELMNGFGKQDDGDDDDDEDEETTFPSNLGKVLREKESAKTKGDWKQQITQTVANTGKTLRRHANKVGNHIRQWWKRVRGKMNSRTGKQEL